jgi:hypothetical protein
LLHESVSRNRRTITKWIVKAGIVLLLTSCAATPSPAQTRQNIFKRVWHFAGHHKELLAANAIIFLSANASAASAVHCIHDVNCRNPIIYGRPETNVHAYAKANLIGLGGATIMNVGWCFRPKDHPGEAIPAHLFLWSIPTLSAVGNGLQTRDQVKSSENGKKK